VSRRALANVVAVGALTAFLVAAPAGPASATITPTSNALSLANAMVTQASVIDGAAFETLPPDPPVGSAPNGVADSGSALASFPTDGSTYAIMTSGDVSLADDADNSESSGANAGGENVRGNSDFDVSILRVDLDVPTGRNCLTVDFRFLSEEYLEYIGGSVNDAFVAELDESTWTTDESEIIADDNFAFDQNGQVVSINSAINGNQTEIVEEAAGTTYDGATPLLRASTPITSGDHSVYFSIFDQGDQIYDSAVFIDRLGLGAVANPEEECTPGATLAPPTVTKTADSPTSEAGGTNGYMITVTNPNTEDIQLSEIQDTLPDGFTYVADSTSGEIGDPSQEGQTLTWTGPFTVPGGGSFELSFDVVVAGEAGEYLNEAAAFADGVQIEPTGPTAPVTVTSTATGPCLPVTLEGTLGSDKSLTGTVASDAIKGLLGRDRIDGLGAADELCGDEGSDFVYGRLGADEIEGGTGNDRLNGNEGADHMDGGPGHDAFFAGQGVDQIDAQDGTKDCIVATPGVDQISRDKGVDLLNPPSGCPAGFWL
jgi:uncharacterized repeat protein (TIGR01451 family)